MLDVILVACCLGLACECAYVSVCCLRQLLFVSCSERGFMLTAFLTFCFCGDLQRLRLLNNLLRRKIKSGQRSLVLVLVARCYLKVCCLFSRRRTSCCPLLCSYAVSLLVLSLGNSLSLSFALALVVVLACLAPLTTALPPCL